MFSLDWVICGGESGNEARPFVEGWASKTIMECRENPFGSVPAFIKQYGANAHRHLSINAALEMQAFAGTRLDRLYQIKFADKKGETPSQWPPEMQVQEQPDWLQGTPHTHPLWPYRRERKEPA